MDIKISEISKLPTKFGKFNICCFKENQKEHLVLTTENLPPIPTIRVHSECLTGDVFKSKRCDCGEQLEFALKYIQEKGGIFIYLRQEGRNIGLLNKINAYFLQDKGMDTVEANHQLGFSADERSYEIVEKILNYFKIKKIKLLTNNPKKIESLKNIEIIERIPIIIKPNPYNLLYLKTKKEKLGHML
jgi:GTP cyclohydrolase II